MNVSFFAFQDIITSVIGIIVVITIFLALSANSLVPTVTQTPVDPKLLAELNQVLAEVAAAKQKVEQLHEGTSSATAPQLKASIAALDAKRKMLADRYKDSSAPAAANSSQSAVSAEIFRDAATTAAALKSVEAANQRESEKLAQLTAEMNRLESAVEAASNELLARQNDNTLRLIPERSDTTKEPVLALVSKGKIDLEAFDSGKKVSLSGSRELVESLKEFSPLNQYLVFYFRPSSFEDSKDIIDAARRAGFEVGYNAIEENVTLAFKRSSGGRP